MNRLNRIRAAYAKVLDELIETCAESVNSGQHQRADMIIFQSEEAEDVPKRCGTCRNIGNLEVATCSNDGQEKDLMAKEECWEDPKERPICER